MRPAAIQAVGQRSGRFAVVPARAIDDARLQAAAFKVLCALSTYSDRDGRCWPSMGALARRLGVTRQAINRQVHVLFEMGYLSITPRQRGDGSTSTHSYRLIFDAELAAVHDRLGNEFENAERRQHEVDSQPSVDRKRQHEVTPPATSDVAPILERTNKNLTVDRSGEAAKQFEIFWRFYPRRQGSNPKKPAREKFLAAVKREIDPAAMVRGAENYAVEIRRDGTAPRFVAQAVTWLNQERWDGYQNAPRPEETAPLPGMC